MKLLDRLFRRQPAPPPTPEAAFAEFLQRLTAAGMAARPADPAAMLRERVPPAPQSMTWVEWAETMKQLMLTPGANGWSPCRFGVRLWLHGEPDRAEFVYGLTKGPLGVFTREHVICMHDHDEQGADLLHGVTFLPTGMGLGVFATREAACKGAASLLESKAAVPWVKIDDHLDEVQAHIVRTWEFNGLAPEDHRHAHSGHGTPALNIWNVVPLTTGAPKREEMS